jgi:hypothetical protein
VHGIGQHIEHEIIPGILHGAIAFDQFLDGVEIGHQQGGIFQRLVYEAGRLLKKEVIMAGEKLIFPAQQQRTFITFVVDLVGPDQSFFYIGQFFAQLPLSDIDVASGQCLYPGQVEQVLQILQTHVGKQLEIKCDLIGMNHAVIR